MNEAKQVIAESCDKVKITDINPAIFWSRISKENECWEYKNAIQGDYGRFTVWIRGSSKSFSAHRISWIFHNGAIPDGLCVLHRCDNRKCVNPSHLFLGTKGDNNRDRANKKRSAQGVNHGLAKLSDRRVVNIRRLHALGVTYRQLARRYGVSHNTIGNVVKGKVWTHVK